MITLSNDATLQNQIVSIKVVGLGGAGNNTINQLVESGYSGIEFIAVNTDIQALQLSKAHHKIQIGVKSTKGQGSGANPEVGKRAIEEDLEKVLEAIGTADIVFLTAGMGGGTGSGSLPVIAKALKDKNILSIAIITKPFLFEGKRRNAIAQNTITALQEVVDTLIVIPNQKLLEVVEEHVSMIDAFALINNILGQSVRGISDIITRPGHINVDYADVRTIMKDRGLAVMGTGKATGARRAEEAALQAISSPLFESNVSIKGARGVLLNITGSSNLGLHEIGHAASIIYELASEDANIILGSVIDESMKDDVMVTIIATGFDQKQMVKPAQEIHQQNKTIQEIQGSEYTIPQSEQQKPYQSFATQQQPQKIVEPVQEPISTPHIAITQQINQAPVFANEQNSGKTDTILIDTSDLDIPTFLRNKQKREQGEL